MVLVKTLNHSKVKPQNFTEISLFKKRLLYYGHLIHLYKNISIVLYTVVMNFQTF